MAIHETPQYRQLWQANLAKRLPHALMFTGVKGAQKNAHADYFSRALACQAVLANGIPCESCHSCRLALGRTHPDILWIQPEKAGAAIKIEQVRTVSDFVQQTSLSSHHRLVIITPADSLNVNAANALLKTLEEPSIGTYIILINDQNGRLPATINSRCQRILFSGPSIEQRYLAMANDEERAKIFRTFIAAFDKKNDRIKLALDLSKSDPLLLTDYILSFVADLLKLQSGANADHIMNRDFAEELVKLSSETTISSNSQLLDHIQKLRAGLSFGINFNKQLSLESILGRLGG